MPDTANREGSDQRPAPAPTPSEGHAVSQLRRDIDSGATGDKVGGLDLAAAPLGTDEEAAGTPVPTRVAEAARAAERKTSGSANANAATPELQPNGQLNAPTPWLMPVLLGVLAAALLAVAYWLLLRL